MSNIIFQINGGIGKCVAATAVIECIKKKYRKDNLIVISGYPDVFLNNPHIHKHFSHGNTPYFYRDFIEKKDFITMLHDPYQASSYLHQSEHLIAIWCKMNDLKYEGEQPKIYLTQRETEFFSHDMKSDKPLFILQTNGGAENQATKYSWARDLPPSVAVQIIENYKNDFNIIHLRREDQPAYQFTTPFNNIFRKVVVLLSMSTKRLLIDSFAQHTCAALNLPSVVCWVANKPEVFGYKLHNNIVSNKWTKKPELRNAFMQQFNIIGDPLEFPYKSEADIFDLETIIEAIDK